MKLRLPKRRLAVLLPILFVAAGLALFGDKTPTGGMHAAAGSRQATSPILPAAVSQMRPKVLVTVPIEEIVPREQLARSSDDEASDLFASPAWLAREVKMEPAPAAAPATVASSSPVETVPPPPPFRFVGKRQDGEEWEVYLGKDDVSFIAKVGSTLESVYRVESISPPTMALIHLPTGATQNISIGDAR